MILDDAFVAAGDENEMLDSGLSRFVNDMLDQRPIDHGQHFLRHCLGRGQEPGAKAGYRKDRFANGFHALVMAGGSAGLARDGLATKLLSKLAVKGQIRQTEGLWQIAERTASETACE
jgi:hypothetical protein